MNLLISILLILHITGGTLALISAPIAIALRKKTPKHRIAGRVYFYSMLLVTATALIIAGYKSNPFLFMVGVFSFYSIWDARRALEQKQLHTGQKAKWYDWAVITITLLFNVGLLYFGTRLLLAGKSFGWVAVAFGGIGITLVTRSLQRFIKRPTDPKHWLYRHVTGMMAGYIATVTAFLAVNITFLPGLVVWLSPTVIGTVVISYLITRLKTGKEQF
jgi:hypothetical protein